jgi:hypothetical protein
MVSGPTRIKFRSLSFHRSRCVSKCCSFLINFSVNPILHVSEPFELEIGEISAQPELLDRITLPAFRPHFEIPDELPERTRITDSENLNVIAQSDLPESHETK